MHMVYPLVLGALLFVIGLYGVLARRNAIALLMAIELLLNAVTINLVAFQSMIADAGKGSPLGDTFQAGQSLTLFIITIAAAETGLGLAIVLLLYRQRSSAAVDEQRVLGEAGDPAPGPEFDGLVPALSASAPPARSGPGPDRPEVSR